MLVDDVALYLGYTFCTPVSRPKLVKVLSMERIDLQFPSF